jgi:hypothetical protein
LKGFGVVGVLVDDLEIDFFGAGEIASVVSGIGGFEELVDGQERGASCTGLGGSSRETMRDER